MAEADLPADVRRLIAGFVSSMDVVEVLRVFAESPDERLTLEALAARVRVDRGIVSKALDELVSANAVALEGDSYFFAPSASDREAIAQLMVAYHTRPVTLVRAIYARPRAITAFADAFRIRRSD